jgi:rRNA maturation endonuclease Nob1
MEFEMKAKVFFNEYVSACQRRIGWCLNCQDFTRELPAASEEGNCKVCGGHDIVAAKEGMALGLFEISFKD